jgi:hypothetical protein
MRNRKGFERNRDLPKGTEKDHEKYQPVSRQGLEPSTTRIQVQTVTSRPICPAFLIHYEIVALPFEAIRVSDTQSFAELSIKRL